MTEKDLSEIHQYLENNVKILNYLYSITEFIQTKKSDNFSDDIKTKIDIESAIFAIVEDIENKRFDWMNKAYSTISQNYEYIKQRIKNTSNFLLKAIYSEILYYSNDSQYRNYIQQAVENYFIVLKEAAKDLSDSSSENFVHSLIAILKKLLHLAVISKSPVQKDIKKFILELVHIDSNVTLYHYLIVTIISQMLEYNKLFKKTDFDGIDDIFWNLANLKFKAGDYHYVISIVEKYASKIDDKRGKLSYPWDDLLGKSLVKSMDTANSNMAARYWCVDAIKHYARLMNKYTNKVKQLEQKYITFKDKLEISEFRQSIDTEPFINTAKDVLNNKPIDIFKILSASNIFYPTLDSLKNKYGCLTDIISTSYLDHNMHPAKISSSKTEQDVLLRNYSNFWQLYQITVQYIFIEGVRENKFNVQDLMTFLINYSCFFDLIPKSVSRNKRIKYNWSATIISIFETYFNEMHKWFKNPKMYYPYLVTITESLVLKFETWIRHYLACHKQPTISSIPQENGIIREKDLNFLLYDDFIIKKFDFNDLLFFRYLFIAKEGLNLRNEIAHGVLIPEQYTVEIFNYVFFAFLRLAKYVFPTAERNKFIKKQRLIKL